MFTLVTVVCHSIMVVTHKIILVMYVTIVAGLLSCSKQTTRESGPGTVTLQFDSTISLKECGSVYRYEKLTASLVKTTADDCGEGDGCGAAVMDDRLALYLGRLEVDVSAYSNISAVSVKVVDNCGYDCTRVHLYNNKGERMTSRGNKQVGQLEAITFSDSLASLSKIAVSSCEGYALEVSVQYK